MSTRSESPVVCENKSMFKSDEAAVTTASRRTDETAPVCIVLIAASPCATIASGKISKEEVPAVQVAYNYLNEAFVICFFPGR